MSINRREFLQKSAAVAAAGALGAGLGACRTTAPPPKMPAPTPRGPDQLSLFEVSEGQAQEVLSRALATGGDFGDLFFQQTRTSFLSLEDSSVNRGYTKLDLGLGVRVIRGVETGYAYTESLTAPSMLAAAEVAAAVSAGASRRQPTTFRAGRLPAYYPVQRAWSEVPTEKRVKLLSRLDELTRAKDKRIKKVSISLQDEDQRLVILDSEGRLSADRQPMLVLKIACTAEDGTRRESNYASLAARAGLELLSEERLAQLAAEAAARTVILFEAVAGPVGELPVVLSPGSSGILLHEAIGHGMEADFARQGETIYADKIGQRIAPEIVTIVDDGTNPGMRGSINVDDEGNASQRTVLVEKGVLRTFIHDRISARHFKLAPTGNGRRQSFRHMPIPRMRNTYMLAGPHSREEIIGSVKRGIYAEHFTNGQVDIGAGDFTFYVKNGRLIEDGKLTAPIKDINIIGNGPRVLEQVTMVGPDETLDQGSWTCGKRGQGVPVGLGLPTVKVAAITVGGTRKA